MVTSYASNRYTRRCVYCLVPNHVSRGNDEAEVHPASVALDGALMPHTRSAGFLPVRHKVCKQVLWRLTVWSYSRSSILLPYVPSRRSRVSSLVSKTRFPSGGAPMSARSSCSREQGASVRGQRVPWSVTTRVLSIFGEPLLGHLRSVLSLKKGQPSSGWQRLCRNKDGDMVLLPSRRE